MLHPNELDIQIDNLRTLQESYDQIATDLQAIKDAHILGFSYDGIIFEEGYEPQSAFGIIANRDRIIEIHDDRDMVVPKMSSGDYSQLEIFEMTNATSAPNQNFLSGSSSIRKIILPSLYDLPNLIGFINSMTNLIYLDLYDLDMNRGTSSPYFTYNCNKLICIKIGKRFSTNRNTLSSWSPTEALLDNSISLLTQEDLDAGFTSNLQKLLYNIREHIAANLPDRTDLTSFSITFSAAVKAAIQADQETSDAFTNKNWTIA